MAILRFYGVDTLEIEFLTSGIYSILNVDTNKFYIGSAVNFNKRWNLHKYKLNQNIHENRYLQAAWLKYGKEAFEFKILEYVCGKSQLIYKEQTWIDYTNCCNRSIGYNLAPTANSQLGVKRSDETKARISASKVGISKTFTIEHKINLSIAARRTPKSKEHRAKLTQATILRCRDSIKWPHNLGSRCKCLECIEVKRIQQKVRRQCK